MADDRRAVLLFEDRLVLADGYIVQGRIWRVPEPVPGSAHRFKYSLFLGRRGERTLLYDNERGKGDHRHYGPREEPYRFETVEKLLSDFRLDVVEVLGRGPACDHEGGGE